MRQISERSLSLVFFKTTQRLIINFKNRKTMSKNNAKEEIAIAGTCATVGAGAVAAIAAAVSAPITLPAVLIGAAVGCVGGAILSSKSGK